MRRSFAGLLLLVSCVLFAVSISSWWLHHVAFSPSADTETTYAILGAEEIRSEVATLIATPTAGLIDAEAGALKTYIEQSTRLYDGATLMNDFVSAAHERLIGDRTEAVVITSEEQYLIVRDERAASTPEIILPVEKVRSLSWINSISWWVALVTAVSGVLVMLVGFFSRPERGEFTFAASIGFWTLSVLLIVFGYLVPLGPLAALSNNAWTGVFPQLASHSRALTLSLSVISAVLGGVVWFTTSGLRQRRVRSTPLSVGRYREQHNWSR